MARDLALATQTDRELAELNLGAVTVQAAAQRMARGASVHGSLTEQPTSGGVPYARLKDRNPDYLGEFWAECRALYSGGARLLRDEAVMDRLFPRNGAEHEDVYKRRRERAFFLSYPGEIIDHLLAGLAQDPLHISAGADEASGEANPLPEWWGEFDKDVSPSGGAKQSLHAFAIDCLREMFLTQSAWVLVDLPALGPDELPPETKLDEERRGLRDPYLCLMPSENVVDWEVDEETGELEWALCFWSTKRRGSILDSRSRVTERWMYWDREGWTKYEHTYDPAQPPKPDASVPEAGRGKHPFGVVPLVRLQVPEGLYAMGKLHSPAREHFNKRCAVAHAENMSLFAVLYEFTGPDQGAAFTPKSPVSKIQRDTNRAVNQVRGQGYTQVRGHQDDARYIGPDPGPFKEARESCAELMREMHRVTFSMALSANMDAAALQRSGDSKEKDSESIAAILVKVGELLRDGFKVVLDMVALVRKELELGKELSITGAEKFDSDSVAAAIEEAVELFAGVPMKSPTFQKLYLKRLYKRALGPDVGLDDLERIEDELETQVTAEAMLADAAAQAMVGQPGAPPGEDPEDDAEGDEPPARAAPPTKEKPPAPGVKRLISSGGK
jgi:hypothetical protein